MTTTRFCQPQRSNHMCKLHEALYELKKAPYAWCQRFSIFTIRHGFLQGQVNLSLHFFTM